MNRAEPSCMIAKCIFYPSATWSPQFEEILLPTSNMCKLLLDRPLLLFCSIMNPTSQSLIWNPWKCCTHRTCQGILGALKCLHDCQFHPNTINPAWQSSQDSCWVPLTQRFACFPSASCTSAESKTRQNRSCSLCCCCHGEWLHLVEIWVLWLSFWWPNAARRGFNPWCLHHCCCQGKWLVQRDWCRHKGM